MYLRNAVILVLLQSNSSGFVPVEFSRARCSIGKQHCGDPFALPPPSTSVLFPQTRDLENATIERNRLDLSDVAENSKAHTPSTFQRIIGREIGPVSRHYCTTSAAEEVNKRWAAGRGLAVIRNWTSHGDER